MSSLPWWRQGHSVLDFLLASLGLRPLPPWRGKVGMGGEKHGLGTPLVFTPTLALPRLRGREKTDRRGSRKLHDPESSALGLDRERKSSRRVACSSMRPVSCSIFERK